MNRDIPKQRVAEVLKRVLERRMLSVSSARQHSRHLLTGHLIANGFAILVSPLLTRLYSPADLGSFAVYFGFFAIASTVASLRLDSAVPIATTTRSASALVLAGTAAVLLVGVVVGIASPWVLARMAGRALGVESTSAMSIPLALSVVSAGLGQLATQWCIRNGAYSLVGSSRVVQTLVQTGVQVALVFVLTPGATGLILGHVVGCAAAAALVVALAPGRVFRFPSRTDRAEIVAALRAFRAFPLLSTPSAALNAAGLHVPLLLFSGTFGAAEVGYIGLAQRVFGIPMALVGQGAAQVYHADASALLRNGHLDLTPLQSATFRRLLPIAVTIVAAAALSPALFPLAFGESWRSAGVYAAIISPWYALQLCVVPLSQTLTLLRRLHWQLAWDASRLTLSCGSVLAAALLRLTPAATLAILAAVSCLLYIALLVICRIASTLAAREREGTYRCA